MAVRTFAAAVALLLATSAQATSTVSASLTSFTSTVNNGSFSWSTSQDNSYFVYGHADEGVSQTTDVFGTGNLFGTGTAQTVGLVTSAKATAGLDSLQISVTTPAAGVTAYAAAGWQGYFDLAAHSSVTFSWVASVSGVTTGTPGSFGQSDVGFGDSLTNAKTIVNGFGPGYSYTYTQGDLGYNFWTVGSKQFASVTTGDNGISSLGFFARAQDASIDVPSVPEPESLALAASGLAVASFLARRRRPV